MVTQHIPNGVIGIASGIKEGISNTANSIYSHVQNAFDFITGKNTQPTTPQDYAQFWNNAFTGDKDYARLNEMWQKAADYNTAAVREQREYQAQREDTAVIRYANQLRELGINPALAIGGQAGATGGTVAQMSTALPQASGTLGASIMGTLLSTAVDVYKINSQIASSLIGAIIPG